MCVCRYANVARGVDGRRDRKRYRERVAAVVDGRGGHPVPFREMRIRKSGSIWLVCICDSDPELMGCSLFGQQGG